MHGLAWGGGWSQDLASIPVDPDLSSHTLSKLISLAPNCAAGSPYPGLAMRKAGWPAYSSVGFGLSPQCTFLSTIEIIVPSPISLSLKLSKCQFPLSQANNHNAYTFGCSPVFTSYHMSSSTSGNSLQPADMA